MTAQAPDIPVFDTQSESGPPVRSPDYGRSPRPSLIYGLIIGYCILHFLIRLFTSPVFSIDEAEQLLMSQSLDIGYRFRHPPLITWIYALADMTVGLSRPVFFLLKYAIMAAGLLAFYEAARNVFRWYDRSTASMNERLDLSAAAVAAWSLVYYPAWGHHEDLMHTVLLFTMLALSLHAFTLAIVTSKAHHWAYFGVTIGFGFLSKYVHVMLPAALILAGLSIKTLTRKERDADGRMVEGRVSLNKIFYAVLIGAAIVAPYGIWTWQTQHSLIDLAGSVTQAEAVTQDAGGLKAMALAVLSSRAEGLASLAQALAEFSLPLSLFFLMLFWPMWFPFVYPFFPRRDVYEDPSDIVWRKLMSRTMLFAAGFYLVAVLAGAESFKARWMHQALMTLPIWLFLQVQRSGPYFIAMRAYAALAILFVVAVAGARVIEWREDIKNCSGCHAYQPMEAWADALTRDEGFRGGTVVGADYLLTGNLRYYLKDTRAVDAEFELSAYPRPGREAGGGDCLAVWRDNLDESPDMPQRLATYLRDDMGVRVDNTAPQGAVRRYLIMSDEKASVLYYRYLRPNESCR